MQRKTGLLHRPARHRPAPRRHVVASRARARPPARCRRGRTASARSGPSRARTGSSIAPPPSLAYTATEPCRASTSASMAAFTAGETSTIVSTPCGAIARVLGGDVLLSVVHDVVGAGARREVGLLRAAHGGDHGGPGPPGELDGGIPHRTGSAGDQHGPPLQRAGSEPGRAVLGDRQAPVRGQERDAEARAEVVRRDVGQQHHMLGRARPRSSCAVPPAGRRCAASQTQTRRPPSRLLQHPAPPRRRHRSRPGWGPAAGRRRCRDPGRAATSSPSG